eukprot:m.23365 g.23365  ORF g.23365 m.23365 type:complete len:279 (+) comp14190_c0_seq1:120-956(+)
MDHGLPKPKHVSSNVSSKPPRVSGIGESLLRKMGWKDGQGLGKDNGGIKNPIDPTLKFDGDTRGLGYNGPKRDKRRRIDNPGGRPPQPRGAPPPPPPKNLQEDLEQPVKLKGLEHLIMRRGLQVRIHGLSKNVALNGKTGFVGQYNEEKQRHVIMMDNGASQAVKQINVLQMLHSVEIVGLKSATVLNGSVVGIVDWDGDKSRYICQAKGGRTLALSPSNVVVPIGAVVTITALTSERGKTLNGRIGKVVWHDRAAARLLVHLSDSLQIKVAYDNIMV